MDNIQLRARLDAIESRLTALEDDGGRFPSLGTRGSLSRPIVDGGEQPRDVHELNDVPADRDDDLMPEVDESQPAGQAHDAADDEANDDGDQVAGDQADQAPRARVEARGAATRRRAASTGSRQQARKRAPRGRR